MAQVIWTYGAASDLGAVRDYVGVVSPVAAQRLAAKLYAAGQSLAEFPNRGRPIGDGLRELTIVWPYLLRYAVVGDTVYVLEIRHGARAPD